MAAVLLASGVALADEPIALDFPVEQYTLDNGLRVVLSPGDRSPTVAISVYYDVGSRNEVEGRTGFAHLFEHMMFQGSANIEKGGHFQYIEANGGRMNGTTSEDRTNYYEILPSDRLGLGLWLESDRMLSLDISAENFENQREVVKEERRLRVDNQPYVPAFLAFQELLYEAFEYEHSVIGSMDDLDAAELADVQAFFDLYYAPNNAVLTIVGDFESADARALVELYFGDIPRGAEPPPVAIVEPPQTEPRELSLDDRLATQPMLLMGWHVPSAPGPEADAVELLNQILTGGESSRLYARLVRNDQLVLAIDGNTDGKRGPDVYYMSATMRGHPPEAAREAIQEEISRLVSGGVTDDEFEAARQRLMSSTVQAVEGNLSLSLIMGRDALYFDDPTRINTAIGRIMAVTREEVQRVAATYLVLENQTTVYIRVVEGDEDAVEGQP
jgi:predicted Zn-dependent peptidase